MNQRVIVITDKDGTDHYYYEGQDFAPKEYISKCVYASLSDAIKGSEPFNNDTYSDGECLDYVLGVIKQLEERE